MQKYREYWRNRRYMQTAVFGGQQGRLFRPCRAAISGQYSENHQQGEALPAVRLLL